MNKIFIFLILSFMYLTASSEAVYAQAKTADAEASIEKDIQLRSNLETVTIWLENHKADLQEASAVEVVENLNDGKIKVQRVSKRGTFIWIMQETIERHPSKVIYKQILVKSLQGGIVYSNTITTVTSVRGGVNINIKTDAGVNNPSVASGEMQMDMKIHTNKVVKVIEKNLR